MINISLRSLMFGLLFPVAIYGCGGEKFPFPKVTGKVTIDGQPGRNITLFFTPEVVSSGGGSTSLPASFGVTDSNGEFTLTTRAGTSRVGAAVGKHTVTFEGLEAIQGDQLAQMKPEDLPSAKLPKKYTNDGVEFVVPEGGTSEANFELTTGKSGR